MNKLLRTVYLEKYHIIFFKELSEETKVPQSVFIRESFDMFIENYFQKDNFMFEKIIKNIEKKY